MDIEKFKNLENKYNDLRSKAEKGEIDSATVNKELKKLMLMDSGGIYWIIGGNSGKWYRYDGKDWKEDNPYQSLQDSTSDSEVDSVSLQSPKDSTTQIIQNQLNLKSRNKDENQHTETNDTEKEINRKRSRTADFDDDESSVICFSCKGKIKEFETYCHICGNNQKSGGQNLRNQKKLNAIPELLIVSVNLVSLIFFLGGIGIIVGVIGGATIGIFKDIPVFIDLPQMLVDLRSNILGGILFAIIGGILGFILFALKAVFLGSIYNMISYFFGGIRFNTKK